MYEISLKVTLTKSCGIYITFALKNSDDIFYCDEELNFGIQGGRGGSEACA